MKELQIQTLHETQLSKNEYLPVFLTYALFITACIKIVFSGFSTIASLWWIYAIAGVLLGSMLLAIPQKKFHEYLLPAGLLFIFLLFFAGFSYSRNGICVLGNEFLTFLTKQTGKIYLDFPVSGTTGAFYAAALGCFLLVLVFTEALYRKNRFLLYVISFLCMIGCAVELFSADYGIFLLLGAMGCLLYSGNYSISKTKGTLSYIFTFIGISLLCALIGILAVSMAGENFSTKSVLRWAKQRSHQVVYDEGTNAMPEGNLKNLTYFHKSSETALVLTSKEPQKLYLRGLIGEVYTGNAWEPLSKEVYAESEDLFYWLHKNDFYEHTSLASAMSLAEAGETYELDVTNVSACREHQYLPYNLSDPTVLDIDKVADGTVDAPKEENFRYLNRTGSLPEWYQTYIYLSEHTDTAKVHNYLTAEQSYRDHAYTYDLQLTNTVIGVMERIFGTEKKEHSLAEIMILVRETLEHNLEYKENVTTPNGKNDFIKYTLEQSREGYSVHYATAAAMMFRYFGVPARYVEGYYISSEEAKNYAPMEEITLTEGHAHAWTEIYLDGIGWIPFEVTPGYIDEEELSAAEQIISDGIGEGGGKSYSSGNLTYKPPKQQEEEQKATERNNLFRFEVKDVLSLLLILLILLFVFAVYRILRRRHRLISFLKEMKHADNKKAITGLFGYSRMLMDTCQVTSGTLDTIEELNTEARFSNHTMTETQRQTMERFSRYIVSKCKKKLSLWKRFYYHYILWLYR